MPIPSVRPGALGFAFVLTALVAACGDDDTTTETDRVTESEQSTADTAGSSASPATTAPTTTSDGVPATTDPATTDPATTDPATTDPATTDPATSSSATDVTATEDAFPVTIQHKFGETTIEQKPTRIVSVGYHEQDFIASLGTPPLMAKSWIGSIVNDWAVDAFDGVEPESFEGDIPFEAIAAMEPDLIVGVYSWIDETEYALLSEIAPTLAQSGDVDDGQMSWQAQLLSIGAAMGESELAQRHIDDLQAKFAEQRAAHPEWEGLTIGIVSDGGDGNLSAYTSGDPRMRFFADLGFDTAALDDLTTDDDQGFWFTFSPENIDQLADLDVVVWYNALAVDRTLATSLPFHLEGREIWVADENWHLFGFQTNLSIGAAVDFLVPELEQATDGDPSTLVPTADAAGIAPSD